MYQEDPLEQLIWGLGVIVIFLLALFGLIFIFTPDSKHQFMIRLAADGVLQVNERGQFLYKGQVIP